MFFFRLPPQSSNFFELPERSHYTLFYVLICVNDFLHGFFPLRDVLER